MLHDFSRAGAQSEADARLLYGVMTKLPLSETRSLAPRKEPNVSVLRETGLSPIEEAPSRRRAKKEGILHAPQQPRSRHLTPRELR